MLALAIQAFGKITDDDVKTRLKDSDDLLAMLCEQAKSGATDLIRWSAATTIKNIGFEITAFSQYLTEEPSEIIHRIVSSKIKILIDSERGTNEIRESNDYENFIRFWIYGATYDLRIATIHSSVINKSVAIVINDIVEAQGVWGIKQTNLLLSKAERKSYPDDSARQVYENNLFEEISQNKSYWFLQKPTSHENTKILIQNQIHCLQSDYRICRKYASWGIFGLDGYLLNKLEIDEPSTMLTARVMYEIEDFISDKKFPETNFTCQRIDELIKNIRLILNGYITRSKVTQDCQTLLSQLSSEIDNRENGLAREREIIDRSKQEIHKYLNELESVNPQTYKKYADIDSEPIPEVSIYDDNWLAILGKYRERINENILKINDIIQYEKYEKNKKIEREQRERNDKHEYEKRNEKVRENIVEIQDIINKFSNKISPWNTSLGVRTASLASYTSLQSLQAMQNYDELKKYNNELIDDMTKLVNDALEKVVAKKNMEDNIFESAVAICTFVTGICLLAFVGGILLYVFGIFNKALASLGSTLGNYSIYIGVPSLVSMFVIQLIEKERTGIDSFQIKERTFLFEMLAKLESVNRYN